MSDPFNAALEALIWPGTHTLGALSRTAGLSGTPLADLYRAVHTRPDMSDSVDILDLPLLAGTGPQFNQALCGVSADIPLTIVATSRNDLHVERMEERTQAFIDGIAHHAVRLKRRIELIMVEWNPPSERPPLADQYDFHGQNRYMITRIITVSRALHGRYRLAADYPLYQMIAKNAGIRRARGQYILLTNIDILFDDAFFDRASTPDGLQPDHLYRANRWDIDRAVLDHSDVAAMITAAPSLLLQRNTRHGTIKNTGELAGHIRPVYDESLPADMQWFPDLHTEGCGDFQLMHRDTWLRLGGYCEVDAFSMHIDSVFAFTCYHAGIREVDWGDDVRHFHIDHSLGQEAKPATYRTRSNKELRHPSTATLYNLHAGMTRLGGAYAFNHDGWGLAATRLPETRFAESVAPENMALDIKQLDAAEGCRIPIEDLIGSFTFSNDQARLWYQQAWDVTAAYLISTAAGRQITLWGAGGRGQISALELSARGIPVGAVVGDCLPPGCAPLQSATLIDRKTLTDADTGRYHFAVASSFAEEIRGELSAIGAAEGRDYTVMM